MSISTCLQIKPLEALRQSYLQTGSSQRIAIQLDHSLQSMAESTLLGKIYKRLEERQFGKTVEDHTRNTHEAKVHLTMHVAFRVLGKLSALLNMPSTKPFSECTLSQLNNSVVLFQSPRKAEVFITACSEGEFELVEACIDNSYLEPETLMRGLKAACFHGYMAIVETILEVLHPPSPEELIELICCTTEKESLSILQRLTLIESFEVTLSKATSNSPTGYWERLFSDHLNFLIESKLIDNLPLEGEIGLIKGLSWACQKGCYHAAQNILSHKKYESDDSTDVILEFREAFHTVIKSDNRPIIQLMTQNKKIHQINGINVILCDCKSEETRQFINERIQNRSCTIL